MEKQINPIISELVMLGEGLSGYEIKPSKGKSFMQAYQQSKSICEKLSQDPVFKQKFDELLLNQPKKKTKQQRLSERLSK
ncbi:hypothetical protein A4G19_06670 [Pasteurellaceae bacterium Macca]|nr:hypothetical protein [Pasteurellaceae bacterium Macca]